MNNDTHVGIGRRQSVDELGAVLNKKATYREYCYQCWRMCIRPAWNSANQLPGAALVGAVASVYGPNVLPGDIGAPKWVSVALTLVLYAGAAWALLVALQMIFVAPFKIYRKVREQIRDLEKIGADDIERLLHGRFVFGNTFLYDAHFVNLCAQYKGKLELGRLKDTFTVIHVPAPKDSLARMGIQFLNARQTHDERCDFYYLDSAGKSTLIENIYAELEILLDQAASFSLKLVWDEGYVIQDEATLQISVRSWTK